MRPSRVIVCAVDFSDFSNAVVEHAFEEANHVPQCELHFVAVIDQKPDRVSDEELETADSMLRTLVSEVMSAFPLPDDDSRGRQLRIHVRSGKPADEIYELCHEARADRLIIGRHGKTGKAGKRARMGGVPADLIGRVPCSTLLVETPDYEEEDFDICPSCAQVRQESAGEMWFCKEHSDGRIPRLVGRAGNPSSSPGWGLW